MDAVLRSARVLLLAILLFPIGMATHEVMHLVIYSALGVRAVLVVTQWRLGLTGTPIFGLHAAPVGQGAVPFSTLVVNNGLGPAAAAVLLLALWLAVGRQAAVARAALLANVLVLLFFSANELAYPLVERFAHVEADVLLLPELNYGVSLAILVLVAAAAGRGGTRRASPAVRETSRRLLPPGGRLPAP